MRTWMITAAATATAGTMVMASSVGATMKVACTAFVSDPSSPSSQFRRKFTSRAHVPPPPLILITEQQISCSAISSSLYSSKSSVLSLQQQIIQGATLKLQKREDDDKSSSSLTLPTEQTQPIPTARETNNIPEDKEQTFTYYVREGRRSEINEIADVLMDSFHPGSQPSFDSYIRRYKFNHLKMCFDAIEPSDRGLYVACAVPTIIGNSSESLFSETNKEQIVGFCSVDGRPPDPSCKIEFLTPSTLAGTSPRPYLSDLGVSTMHRRRGIGEKLVRACEQWTNNRGYEKLYLKVDKKNIVGVRLYSALGYRKTNLPWGNDVPTSEFDTTVLMEKSVVKEDKRKRGRRTKRTWIKNQLWEPIKASISLYSERANNAPPL